MQENTPVIFQEGKSYEFFLAWLNPNGQEPLGKYFEASVPIRKIYGRPEPQFKANLNPLSNAPQGKTILNPHMAGIVEWDKHEDAELFTGHPELSKIAKPLFDKAIQRIEWIHTQVMLK
ncbi:MAG: hypothetical protein HC880_04475 [Bacteroidia bacterium]|nr:hypothetical protein [Bacteroidia bacterium]